MRVRRLAIGAWAALISIGLLAPAPAAASGSGGVLVVGDSLELLTIPYLQRYLPGVRLTTNAVGGYNSYQIYDLFRESYDPSQSVIVFDAGTNDNPAYPQILAGNLAKVAARIGDRCMVVPTVHGYTVDGIGNEGKNRTVRVYANTASVRLLLNGRDLGVFGEPRVNVLGVNRALDQQFGKPAPLAPAAPPAAASK